MRHGKLLIGIGNRMRGDDAAGLEVAERLLRSNPKLYDVRFSNGEPGQLMDLWSGYDEVTVVDAVVTGLAAIGTIYFWNVDDQTQIPTRSGTSSHGLGLFEAIELARVLHTLPERLEVIGIEAAAFDITTSIHSRVERAIENVVEKLSLEPGETVCTNHL